MKPLLLLLVLWSAATTGVTFNRDIAPFPLTSYTDVRRHASQIAAVTKSRYMPPWLPAPGIGDFTGSRRLATRPA